MTTFAMEKIPCRLEDDKKAKKRAKAENEDGPVTHKIRLVFDVYRQDRLKQAGVAVPGLGDFTKAIAAAENAGVDVRPKKNIGTVCVELFDPDGVSWFKDPIAQGGRPTIQIGQHAKDTVMVIPLEVAVPREKEIAFRDFYRADALGSIAAAQGELDLAMAKDAKPKKTKGGKKRKPREQIAMAAIGESEDGFLQ